MFDILKEENYPIYHYSDKGMSNYDKMENFLKQSLNGQKGKIVCYDMKNMLDKEVFKPLRDISVFIDTCTIMNDTLAWDIGGNRDARKCIDIDPDTLYELPYCKEQIV